MSSIDKQNKHKMIYTPTPVFWEHQLSKPLEQRVATAPAELVEFVTQFNEATGSLAKPLATEVPDDFMADLQSAIRELPDVVKDRLNGRLLGVFLMTGVGSSAVTDVIAYANGDLIGAFVAIDVDVFINTTANAWATWKENTPFTLVAGVTLDAVIADETHNDRKAALQYVLLHEFGHVLTANTVLMPDWWSMPDTVKDADQYAFLPLSWRVDENRVIVPLASEDFPLRKQIIYYETPKLSGDDLPVAYRDLANTSFPTLYAAMSVYEDFAESFATYVHSVLLKKPFDLRVYQNGQLVSASGDFWASDRSQTTAAFFAVFFDVPPMPLYRQPPQDSADPGVSSIPAFPVNYETAFLGLAPFLRISVVGGDLRPIAQMLLAKAGEQENNPYLWMNLATAFFSIGQREMGLTIQSQALLDQRSYFIPAAKQPAKQRLFVLVAAGDLAENAPIDCLLDKGSVDLAYYFATLDAPLPPNAPEHDALFVAISDTEESRAILNKLEPLISQWDKPVINLPQHIVNVEREAASRLLQAVPGLSMPMTGQVSRAGVAAAIQTEFPYPIILRPVGSHAGKNLAKLENAEALVDYLGRVQDESFYISRFIDYSGDDGLFRKYRIALINGQPFASHMAISSHWMIHYLNAGMYEDAAKRAEEEAFMANFDAFAQKHQSALAAIHQRSKLEYVCVDCAETREGDLLIFEIDHAMVVHAMDSTALFPYKQVYMQQVKQAFEDYLGTL
jgi:glutathione synthase/RimK-type ligase-like ATP-grasp enzyme